jgi:hypothetical protein
VERLENYPLVGALNKKASINEGSGEHKEEWTI